MEGKELEKDKPITTGTYLSKKKKVEPKKKAKKILIKAEVILVKESSLIVLIGGHPTTVSRGKKFKNVAIGDKIEV